MVKFYCQNRSGYYLISVFLGWFFKNQRSLEALAAAPSDHPPPISFLIRFFLAFSFSFPFIHPSQLLVLTAFDIAGRTDITGSIFTSRKSVASAPEGRVLRCTGESHPCGRSAGTFCRKQQPKSPFVSGSNPSKVLSPKTQEPFSFWITTLHTKQ